MQKTNDRSLIAKFILVMLFAPVLLLQPNILYSQVKLINANYQNQVRFPDENINVRFQASDEVIISVKGLNNVKADSYLAVFSVLQMGETAEEVNRIIDERINKVISVVSTLPDIESYIDLISFVPVYDYEIEKRLFSKTYNEIPSGFELKKNIHIAYKDSRFLNKLISICAEAEIYDIVKVEFISLDLGEEKNELVKRSNAVIDKKLKRYSNLLKLNPDSLHREIIEGFKVFYPGEMYKSYQAYSGTDLNEKKSSKSNKAKKSITSYYQPVIDKEFDFVINPEIMEPVIQVMYEVKLKIKLKAPVKSAKDYLLITPSGDLKKIELQE